MNEKIEKYLEEKVNKACIDIMNTAQHAIDGGYYSLEPDHLGVWLNGPSADILNSFLKPRVEAEVIPQLEVLFGVTGVRLEVDVEDGYPATKIVIPVTDIKE